MINWRATTIGVSIFMLSGCASSDVIELSAAPDQQSITRDGTPSLVSAKKHVVMIRPTSKTMDSSGRPTFVLAINNSSSGNVDFRESAVTARLSANGQPLRVYRFSELVAEEKRRQQTQAIIAGLGAVAGAYNAANAGRTTTHGTYSGYNSYGGNSYGSFNATTYDPNRAMLAQQLNTAQTARNFANIKNQGEANLSRLENTTLKDQTVFPSEWHGGTIVLDKPPKNDSGGAAYSISVKFDGEVHQFDISQQKAR